MRRTAPDALAVYTWAPDDNSLLIRVISTGDKFELWRAMTDRAAAVKLNATLESRVRLARLIPDGRQIAFQVNEPPKQEEVWITENFLPKAQQSR